MLTVVIPSYNHEDYIQECLLAALDVKIDGLKVIVIDDGSKDQTPTLIRKVLQDQVQGNVRFIEKENSGLVDSLNIALGLVDTEYMYIVASDDVPIPRGIETCTLELMKNPGFSFCIGGALNIFENGASPTLVYGSDHARFFNNDFEEKQELLFMDFPSPILLQSTIFKVSELRAIGGWDKSLWLDDYPTFVKVLKRNPVLSRDYLFLPDIITVKYRHHGTNSYGNVERQYTKVKQSIEALAPPHVRQRAIARIGAFYGLVALRKMRLRTVIHIFATISALQRLVFPYYAIVYLIRKFFKK